MGVPSARPLPQRPAINQNHPATIPQWEDQNPPPNNIELEESQKIEGS
jgi:hypothetical protein